MNKDLKLRMYFLVMYNLSDIQKGIQAGHALNEYVIKFKDTDIFKNWSERYKTFILLNGGTSNDGLRSCYGEDLQCGTMQLHEQALTDNDIPHACFYEPDANGSMTAIAFIVDERTYNVDYLPFDKYVVDFYSGCFNFDNDFVTAHKDWIKYIGGKGNAFLQEFLPQFELA